QGARARCEMLFRDPSDSGQDRRGNARARRPDRRRRDRGADRSGMTLRVAAIVCLTVLFGCATGGDIDTNVDFCCGPKQPAPSTYSIATISVPGFLVAPLRGALGAALSARGWREVDRNPDALITLQFAAVYPDRPLANDGFADPLATGGPRKFEARVTL